MKIDIGNYPNGNRKRKVKVHIDNWDCFNLDHTLALVISKALETFKKNSYAHPSSLTPEKWAEFLEKMCWSFEELTKEDRDAMRFDEKKWTKVEEGLILFARWYADLWC